MRTWRRVLWVGAAFVFVLAGGCAILMLPTTTRQGVNYRVTAHRIPAYVKTLDFLQRHYQYELLVSRICSATRSDQQCLLTIFDWTHENIRPTPSGWPIIDDHPLHIVIRGHGTGDQMADVFTTLATYAGVPAFMRLMTPAGGRALWLAFAELGGRWIPFDVENHVVWRNARGELASVDDLVGDRAAVDAVGHSTPGGIPYSTFINRDMLMPFDVPDPPRAYLQQPWPRIRYELGHVFASGRK